MPEINVLVVEDEEAIREMLALVLEQAELSVVLAADAQQGTALLAAARSDFAGLDAAGA